MNGFNLLDLMNSDSHHATKRFKFLDHINSDSHHAMKDLDEGWSFNTAAEV